ADVEGVVQGWDVTTRKPSGKPIRCSDKDLSRNNSNKDLSRENSIAASAILLQPHPLGAAACSSYFLTNSQLRAADLSRDGKWLAVGLANDTVEVWDLQEGKRSRILRGGMFRIEAVALSADAKLLLTGSWRKPEAARLWDVTTGTEKAWFPHTN